MDFKKFAGNPLSNVWASNIWQRGSQKVRIPMGFQPSMAMRPEFLEIKLTVSPAKNATFGRNDLRNPT